LLLNYGIAMVWLKRSNLTPNFVAARKRVSNKIPALIQVLELTWHRIFLKRFLHMEHPNA
jgi:hypothetical protein